jgi:hypothetical protein
MATESRMVLYGRLVVNTGEVITRVNLFKFVATLVLDFILFFVDPAHDVSDLKSDPTYFNQIPFF